MSQSPFIQELPWRPLVLVPPQHLGLLIVPGAIQTARLLGPGWYWRWPGLTTLRLINQDPFDYKIQVNHTADQLGDEPIVVVTQDHQLLTLTGQLTLQLATDVSAESLSRLGKKFIDHHLRPLIRQQLRQIAANYKKADLKPSADLNHHLAQAIQAEIQLYSLKVLSLEINRIENQRLKRV